MKQSLMTNVIEFACTGTGTLSAPVALSQYPNAEYITGIIAKAGSIKFMFRLYQDGKQIFPVRTNLPNGYYCIANSGAAEVTAELYNLWIPVNPNLLLTIEFCYNDGTAATGLVTLIIGSEDERTIAIDALKEEIKKWKPQEVKK